MQWLEALGDLKLPDLIRGSHPDGPEHGMCAMEMISFMERQPFSDNPKGVCNVLRGFTICINDLLPHGERQKLKPILPMLVDTEGDAFVSQERQRLIENRVLRNWDHYTGRREAHYDMERDRMRYRSHPDHRFGHHLHQLMSEGPKGWVRLMQEVLPPWHAADVLIAILKEAAAVNHKPRVEFNTTGGNKKSQVKKLAEVIYLPEKQRKSGMYPAKMMEPVGEMLVKETLKHNYDTLIGKTIVSPKASGVIAMDVAV